MNALEAITQNSLLLFLAFARDAGNWGGQPLVGGNVVVDSAQRGNLTQLKVSGLVETYRMDGQLWLRFTDAGRALAKQHGLEIEQ